jgi:ankyrin repeat protein
MLSAGEGESGGIGNTALHDAAANARSHLGEGGGGTNEELDYGLSIDVVMEVFHANPAAVKLPNADGALPLHIAARYGSLSLIQLLHGLYPAAVNVADNEDLLPYVLCSTCSSFFS